MVYIKHKATLLDVFITLARIGEFTTRQPLSRFVNQTKKEALRNYKPQYGYTF